MTFGVNSMNTTQRYKGYIHHMHVSKIHSKTESNTKTSDYGTGDNVVQQIWNNWRSMEGFRKHASQLFPSVEVNVKRLQAPLADVFEAEEGASRPLLPEGSSLYGRSLGILPSVMRWTCQSQRSRRCMRRVHTLGILTRVKKWRGSQQWFNWRVCIGVAEGKGDIIPRYRSWWETGLRPE